MNMVSNDRLNMETATQKHPENLAAAYKEIVGGEVLENPFSGGTACPKTHANRCTQRGLWTPSVPRAHQGKLP